MIQIDKEKCIGCGDCCGDCPSNILVFENSKARPIADKCLLCGHCIAICPTAAVLIDEYDMKEVKEYQADTFDLDEDSLLNAIKFRRSVRHFQDKPVEPEKIAKIIEAGRFSPTGTNAQDVSYIVVQNEIMTIQNMAMKTFRRAFNVYKAISKVIKLPYDAAKFELDDNFMFKGAPALILVVSGNSVNAALASANMALLAEAQGLGVLYVGFFTIIANVSARIKRLLQLPRHQKVITCLAIGYPAVHFLRTVPRNKPKIQWR
jgi:nitroreductase/NAD-dependent dihydropyrimidine dehydrogenase PreA subunit